MERILIKSYRKFNPSTYEKVSNYFFTDYVPERKYFEKTENGYKYFCGPFENAIDFLSVANSCGKQLYFREEHFDERNDLKGRIAMRIAWFRFCYWQKHDLFNYAIYAHNNISDWGKDAGKIFLLGRRAAIAHDRLFPVSPFYGYTEGSTILETTKDLLTSSAMYMVLFGHVIDCTQRRMIREMWYARKLIKNAMKYEEKSEEDQVDNALLQYEKNKYGKTYAFSFVFDKQFDKQYYFYLDENGKEAEKSIQDDLTSENARLYKEWANNLKSAKQELYRKAFDYIADHVDGWWD